jgi:hypothetical protein
VDLGIGFGILGENTLGSTLKVVTGGKDCAGNGVKRSAVVLPQKTIHQVMNGKVSRGKNMWGFNTQNNVISEMILLGPEEFNGVEPNLGTRATLKRFY